MWGLLAEVLLSLLDPFVGCCRTNQKTVEKQWFSKLESTDPSSTSMELNG